MTKWTKRFYLSAVAIILIVMAFLGQHYIHSFYKTNTRIYSSKVEPVIFVPGSSATQERFNPTFRALKSLGISHSVVKVTVSKEGKLTTTGSISAKDRRPYIVIAFEDNTDSYATIKKQAAWLDQALTQLQSKYHFRRFDAVGHSNGGLDWTVYLENYYPDSNFEIKTLLTIGTPYNLDTTNINNRTQMLTDLIEERGSIPENLTVYSIAGTNSYDGDYLVPFTSVEAGKYIFQKQVSHYTLITVTGDDADHSSLPENTQVIQYIAQYIFNQTNNKVTNRAEK